MTELSLMTVDYEEIRTEGKKRFKLLHSHILFLKPYKAMKITK